LEIARFQGSIFFRNHNVVREQLCIPDYEFQAIYTWNKMCDSQAYSQLTLTCNVQFLTHSTPHDIVCYVKNKEWEFAYDKKKN